MKEKELNKYQKALKKLEVQCETFDIISYIDLKELVEKETPKKPIIRKEMIKLIKLCESKVTLCPNCKEELTDDAGCYNDYHDVEYCPFCGQHLDWEDEDE